MFVLMKSRTDLKTDHIGSKTRSLGQILEKPCVCFKVHIFDSILMKLGQNVCLDKIWDKFENWSCGGQKVGHWVKSYKNLVYALETSF